MSRLKAIGYWAYKWSGYARLKIIKNKMRNLLRPESTTDKKSEWFIPSVHHSLTEEEVKKVSDDLNYQCSPELIAAISEYTSNTLKSLDVLDSLYGYLPEVKYPRTPGRKPRPEENTGNAWAWLCDIPGASQGKLSGKRVAIKDNVAVSGVPMSNGSRVLEGYVPEYDATIVTRILDAGGRIVGKTTCDDFCCSAMGYSSIERYVHLPNTPDLRVGGSSGGSTVLVAAGEVDMAIAADQGGSIRIPSAWSGVVGLKPTYGLVPYTGIVSIEPTLDHVGPVAKSVADCALFLEVLAGSNGIDPRQRTDIVVPEYSKLLENEATFKLGILKEGFDCCDEDVRNLAKSFLEKASSLENVTCADVSTPLHKIATPIFIPIIMQGAQTNFQMGTTPQLLDGFHSTSLTKAVQQGAKCSGRHLAPGMTQITMMGEIMTRRYGNHYYAKARNLTIDLRQQIDEVLGSQCDVLIMPTLTKLPAKIVTKENGEKESLLKYLNESIFMVDNTLVYNLTGHPALTIPLGKIGDPSMPGLMIVGRKFEEVKVLQVGRALEKLVQASL